jgi:hypothetical protein
LVKAVQELSEFSGVIELNEINEANMARDSVLVLLEFRIDQLEESMVKDLIITSLESRIEQLEELVNRLLDEDNATVDSKTLTMPNASLEQNFPNPFDHVTTIRYDLPQSFRSAKIVITSTSGKSLKQIPLSGSKTGQIRIEAGSFPTGMYFYSLYVDNTLVETKKMIVSN